MQSNAEYNLDLFSSRAKVTRITKQKDEKKMEQIKRKHRLKSFAVYAVLFTFGAAAVFVCIFTKVQTMEIQRETIAYKTKLQELQATNDQMQHELEAQLSIEAMDNYIKEHKLVKYEPYQYKYIYMNPDETYVIDGGDKDKTSRKN